MRDATQFVTERARQMSGAAETPGMPAYPLYGLGQVETDVVWYRRPIVIFPLGVAVGFGLGYVVFCMALPALADWAEARRIRGGRVRRNARVPKIEVQGEAA